MTVRLGGPRYALKEKDLVETPQHAAQHLIDNLPEHVCYFEPCAGAGKLVKHLDAAGHICSLAWDIDPRADWIEQRDCAELDVDDLPEDITHAISNPPYSRRAAKHVLDAVITWPLTTWLLVPQRWLSNLWFQPYLQHIWQLLPIGKVKWIDGSAHASTDDFCWIRFERIPYALRDWDDGGPFILVRRT